MNVMEGEVIFAFVGNSQNKIFIFDRPFLSAIRTFWRRGHIQKVHFLKSYPYDMRFWWNFESVTFFRSLFSPSILKIVFDVQNKH